MEDYFKQFAKAVNDQFELMVKEDVFVVGVTKDELDSTYQNAFKPEDNPIYSTNAKHDCNCCKRFIRNIGGMVIIKDNKLVSVWDIKVDSFYQDVADKLSALVKSKPISAPFKRSEKKYGEEKTTQMLDTAKIKDGVVINAVGDIVSWNHFYSVIPTNYLSATPSQDISGTVSSVGVLRRGLEELSLKALEEVQKLITEGTLYLGDQFAKPVQEFIKLHKQYNKKKTNKEFFVWQNAASPRARFRNTVIGTLVTDITEVIKLTSTPEERAAEITICIKSYNKKTDPEKYKRAEATEISERQAKELAKTIEKLGIEPSLHRRLAVSTDVSINNVIYADSATQEHMKGGIAGLLATAVKKPKANTKNVTDIGIEDFKANILSKGVQSLEMQLSNTHKNNLMTLVAPTDEKAPSIFKWNNNYSWSYNGNITDSSMKDNVKALGGKVDGILRGSIQWNETKSDNQNDLDIHCKSPRSHIYFSNTTGSCGGSLDVDITRPGEDDRAINGVAVENISWAKGTKLPNGEYIFYVNNYSGRNTGGFRAEIEVNGEVHTFNYDKSVTRDVVFATVTHKDGKFTVTSDLPSKQVSQNVYGITTEEFHKVSMVMLSPNHWDDQEIGNKHHFFILDGCNADEPTNGFYNEFLANNLNEHRKVFEVLSSKMRCPVSEASLSGLGFSSTKRDSVLAKADGRMYNIKF